jgi:hypothetical protein
MKSIRDKITPINHRKIFVNKLGYLLEFKYLRMGDSHLHRKLFLPIRDPLINFIENKGNNYEINKKSFVF